MIRAVVVEDEPLAARFLAALLAKTEKVEVAGVARDAVWGLTLCADHEPDALFLDVEMPGADGLHLAAQVSQLAKRPLTVFTTGHRDYAPEAFRLEAVDYLVKPLEPQRVWDAVGRLETRLANRPCPDYERTMPLGLMGGRLPVKSAKDDVVKLLSPYDIVAALFHHRRTWIHTATEEFATYYRLCELLAWLGDPFLRISREAIVNLQAVDEVVHYGDRLYQVLLRDREGTRVEASRSGAGALAALLKSPF